MVSGFAQHDRFDEALEYFSKMHRENFVLNEYSFGSALSACSGLMDLKMGIQIHALVSKSCYSSDVYMGSALIDMYSKCGSVACAQRVFDRMSERNRVSWNSMITCYEQNGPANEALEVFVKMMDCGIEPDEVTLASVVSETSLVSGYAKAGSVKGARLMFTNMMERNVVSWNSLIAGIHRMGRMKRRLGSSSS
jgi:pentatricopeptide repeat protein